MRSPSLQRGATLIVMATVLVLGFAWFTVGALGKNAVTTAEREAKTAAALQSAKKALLGHVAHYAALTSFEFPGRMLCPESLSAYGNPLTEGEAPGACSNTSAEIGRLPWKTLGIDQLRDGDGEPLWYVLSPNFHPVSFPLNPAPPDPYLNFGTPAALPFDGSNVVAVIIAPGRALQSNPCNAVNQQVSRYTTPLAANKFFECGNATGSYTNPGSGTGSNDRVLAITQAEWADAIAGAVADRIQRQVAPALEDFRMNESTASWGKRFLPNASTFSNPVTNSLCGADTVREGLMPASLSDRSSCTSWTGGTVTQLGGLLGSASCSQVPNAGYQCTFVNLSVVNPLVARVRATAPNLGGAFRAPISAANVSNDRGGAVSNFSFSYDYADYEAEVDFRLTFPILSVGTLVTVTIQNLPDAAVVNDARARWFFSNDWGRHTYYAIGRGARFNGGGTCDGPGDSDCLTLSSLPPAHGSPSDKHFLMALMGRALPEVPQTQPSASAANYVESRTSPIFFPSFVPGSPDRFTWSSLSSTYNDRFATCPFDHVDASGATRTIC